MGNLSYSNNKGVINIHSERKSIIDGIEYPWRKEMKGRFISIVNSHVYIDGYELTKKGEWKRTARALFHSII